ncbi:MAG: 2-hydroxyacyl-CoA dehydratase family protein [Planctomycetota bacterium]
MNRIKTLGYCNPLVPPEWIAAHGFVPRWLPWTQEPGLTVTRLGRGLCPFAGQVADAVRSGVEVDAIVLTTTCDQMRRIADLVEHEVTLPVFLANIPVTWETETSRKFYLEELQRLGRWLVALGGTAPTGSQLASLSCGYEEARVALLAIRDRMSARQFSEAILALRSGDFILPSPVSGRGAGGEGEGGQFGIPLAILGGPLAPQDFDLFDLVEAVGGRVVLDATDAGLRTLPAAFDRRRMDEDPLAALADAYFTTIPDVFRRPNDALYRWLAAEIEASGIRGILFRRYLGCDLWHAELFRLKQWSSVPLLEIDVVGAEGSARCRTSGRLEAFLEMLR